ncbi:MAG: GSCFA domain-containing protein [Chitinivibrionales bacterium]
MESPSFRTEVRVKDYDRRISLSDTILSTGSCFSDVISGRLSEYRFNVLNNPSGTMYNPESIRIILERLFDRKEYSGSELIYFNNKWHSLDHYTKFCFKEKEKTLESINRSFRAGADQLEKADFLIVTFGTAFAYTHIDTGRRAANCHKMPSESFRRELLSVKEIVAKWQALIKRLQKHNPEIRIIMSVSPVRHIRDSMHENQVSKSVCHLSVYKLCSAFENIEYFPSYEILIDELRDYRFYKRDMIHLSETAKEYIWSKFSNGLIDERGNSFIHRFRKLLQGLKHRVEDPADKNTRVFADKMLQLADVLERDYPEVSLKDERGYFSGLSSPPL